MKESLLLNFNERCYMSCRLLTVNDINQFGVVFAGAQKNLGPSGVTAVILSPWAVEKSPGNLSPMLDYRTQVAKREGKTLDMRRELLFHKGSTTCKTEWLEFNGRLASAQSGKLPSWFWYR